MFIVFSQDNAARMSETGETGKTSKMDKTDKTSKLSRSVKRKGDADDPNYDASRRRAFPLGSASEASEVVPTPAASATLRSCTKIGISQREMAVCENLALPKLHSAHADNFMRQFEGNAVQRVNEFIQKLSGLAAEQKDDVIGSVIANLIEIVISLRHAITFKCANNVGETDIVLTTAMDAFNIVMPALNATQHSEEHANINGDNDFGVWASLTLDRARFENMMAVIKGIVDEVIAGVISRVTSISNMLIEETLAEKFYKDAREGRPFKLTVENVDEWIMFLLIVSHRQFHEIATMMSYKDRNIQYALGWFITKCQPTWPSILWFISSPRGDTHPHDAPVIEEPKNDAIVEDADVPEDHDASEALEAIINEVEKDDNGFMEFWNLVVSRPAGADAAEAEAAGAEVAETPFEKEFREAIEVGEFDESFIFADITWPNDLV